MNQKLFGNRINWLILIKAELFQEWGATKQLHVYVAGVTQPQWLNRRWPRESLMEKVQGTHWFPSKKFKFGTGRAQRSVLVVRSKPCRVWLLRRFCLKVLVLNPADCMTPRLYFVIQQVVCGLFPSVNTIKKTNLRQLSKDSGTSGAREALQKSKGGGENSGGFIEHRNWKQREWKTQ